MIPMTSGSLAILYRPCPPLQTIPLLHHPRPPNMAQRQRQPSLPRLQSTLRSPLPPTPAAAAAAAAQSITVYKEKQATHHHHQQQQRRCYQQVMDLGERKEDGRPRGHTRWSEPWQVVFFFFKKKLQKEDGTWFLICADKHLELL